MQKGREGHGVDASMPMLAVEDMLPGLAAGVPAIITTYSGGASCDGSDAAAKRSAKVQNTRSGWRASLFGLIGIRVFGSCRLCFDALGLMRGCASACTDMLCYMAAECRPGRMWGSIVMLLTDI